MKRAQLISTELNSKVIEQQTGNEVQAENEEELEKEEIVEEI